MPPLSDLIVGMVIATGKLVVFGGMATIYTKRRDVLPAPVLFLCVMTLVGVAGVGTVFRTVLTGITVDLWDYVIATVSVVTMVVIARSIRKYDAAPSISVHDKAVRELKQSNMDLENFAYAASHDLQEPVRMQIAFGQIAKELVVTCKDHVSVVDYATLTDAIDRVVDGGLRLQSMVQAILDFSRVSRSRERKIVDLREVVADVLKSIEMQCIDNGSKVGVDVLYKVEGDRDLLTTAFMNVIGNAVKFSGTNGEVIVYEKCAKCPQSLKKVRCVVVEDDGPGIEKEHLGKIWEMFRRLHTRDERGGDGIGLAMTMRIVEHHGGTCWAESIVGCGTRIYLALPEVRDGG